MITKPMREIAEAFLTRRHIVRGELSCFDNKVQIRDHVIAERVPDGSIWMILFGLPHQAVAPLNAICELYGFGHPYRVETPANIWFFNNVEISTMEWRMLAGPLAVLAIETERNNKLTT